MTLGHLLLGALIASRESVVSRELIQSLSECLVSALAAPNIVDESSEIPFDPAASDAIYAASRLAQQSGQNRASEVHVLVACIEAANSPWAECLAKAGIEPKSARQRFLKP